MVSYHHGILSYFISSDLCCLPCMGSSYWAGTGMFLSQRFQGFQGFSLPGSLSPALHVTTFPEHSWDFVTGLCCEFSLHGPLHRVPIYAPHFLQGISSFACCPHHLGETLYLSSSWLHPGALKTIWLITGTEEVFVPSENEWMLKPFPSRS